jgi:WD40 repeat protein
MSFYGQKTNSGNISPEKHLLECVVCYNFLGLDFNPSVLDNIRVSEEDFELLVSVIDLVGYDDKTIRLINENIPDNYDLSKLSKELLNEMLVVEKSYSIASGSYDGSIKIWSSGGYLMKTIIAHTEPISCICCSPDNNYIASASEDSTIKIWNIISGELVNTFEGHDLSVICICYSPDGKQIASGGADSSIKVWDTVKYNLVSKYDYNSGNINDICYSSDGIDIVYCYENIITIQNAINCNYIIDKRTNDYIQKVCYSPDDRYIISGNFSHAISLWDVNTLTKIYTIDEHTDMVHDICFSPDHKYFASASRDRTIKLWEWETQNLIKTFKLWDIEILQEKTKKLIKTDWAKSICFSPDNKHIISSSHCRNIYVWDIETSEIVNNLSAHTGNINSVKCFTNHDSILEQRITELLKEN